MSFFAGPTDGDIYCPYGSEEIQPSSCPLTQIYNAVDFALWLFGGAIPAEIGQLWTAFDPGDWATAAVCAGPPPVVPRFDPTWLFQPTGTGAINIVGWLLLAYNRWIWTQCCTCSPPAIGPWLPLANGAYPCATSPASNYFTLPAAMLGTPINVRMRSKMDNCHSPTLNSGMGFSRCATPGCSGGAAGESVTVGPAGGSTLAYSAWWTSPTLTWTPATGNNDVVKVNWNSGCVSNCGAFGSGEWFLDWQPAGGTISLPSTPPPSLPPPYVSPPAGSQGLNPPYPISSNSCNYAPIAANWIERLLAPRSRVADGSPIAVSGAGVVAIPSGAVGWTINLTAYPPTWSHDAGDPPQLYQVGWTAPSIDGAELSGPPQQIKSDQQQFWQLRPTDAYVSYNLYPGFAASIQFWNTGTPD
jgi:hypothetical protein